MTAERDWVLQLQQQLRELRARLDDHAARLHRLESEPRGGGPRDAREVTTALALPESSVETAPRGRSAGLPLVVQRLGPRPDHEPTWLGIARGELGVCERLDGHTTHPRVLQYLASIGVGHEADEVVWGSAFVHWCLRSAGVPVRAVGARARSWLRWGQAEAQPRLGCVVVLMHGLPQGPGGHVGLYTGEDASRVCLLGAQRTRDEGAANGPIVGIRLAPKTRVLGLRWPAA